MSEEMNQLMISFIVPAYNESTNLANLMKEIHEEMHNQLYSYEVIFIDDGSTDNTIEVIQDLVLSYHETRYVSFTRNFGKEAAILAGLQHADGAAIIIMDADLQHPISMIPKLLMGFEEGYDQVIAKRNRKGDSRMRSIFSTNFYRLANRTIDVELTNGEGDFRLLSRKAVNALLQLSEGNRFSKGLYSWIGLEQKTISYENVVRKKGKTNWTFANLLNYGIDGIISFNTKPLRICFYMGTFILFLSLLYIIATFIQILQHGVDVPGYFTTITAVLFLGGIQLLSLGVIGEYIGRIYNETKKRPHYLVKQSNIERVIEKRE